MLTFSSMQQLVQSLYPFRYQQTDRDRCLDCNYPRPLSRLRTHSSTSIASIIFLFLLLTITASGSQFMLHGAFYSLLDEACPSLLDEAFSSFPSFSMLDEFLCFLGHRQKVLLQSLQTIISVQHLPSNNEILICRSPCLQLSQYEDWRSAPDLSMTPSIESVLRFCAIARANCDWKTRQTAGSKLRLVWATKLHMHID